MANKKKGKKIQKMAFNYKLPDVGEGNGAREGGKFV